MNARLLRCSRFALPALLALTPAVAAQTQHRGADVDVYLPVAQAASSKGSVRSFDADWTADGRLAMAFVEWAGWNNSLKVNYDRVVVALREPGIGTRVLGVFETYSWRVEHVSLAVPDVVYGNADLDRVFVAVTAVMGVAGSEKAPSVSGYEQEVRVVRLLSVPLDLPGAKLTVATAPNLAKPTAVHYSIPMPNAQVSVGGFKQSYVVDLAFVDPNGTYGGGDQIMASRSFDAGKSLQDAFHVTGPCSKVAAMDPLSPLVNGLFRDPSVAWDESSQKTVLAFYDPTDGVVRLASGRPLDKHFELEYSTPDNDSRAEYEPRVAVLEGRVNFTCRAGPQDKYEAGLLTWYTGVLGVKGSFQELPPLHPKALSRGDLEVNGSKGLIAVIGLDDAGARRAFWIEANRSLTAGSKTVEVVDDDLTADPTSDVVEGAACSARTPHGSAADRRTPLFVVRAKVNGSYHVRMDP